MKKEKMPSKSGKNIDWGARIKFIHLEFVFIFFFFLFLSPLHHDIFVVVHEWYKWRLANTGTAPEPI